MAVQATIETVRSLLGAQIADSQEGLTQQRLGKAGAQGREQGRKGGLTRMMPASRRGPSSVPVSSRQLDSPSSAPNVTGRTARSRSASARE